MSKHLQISTMHVFYKSLQYKKMYKGFQPFFCPQKKKNHEVLAFAYGHTMGCVLHTFLLCFTD